MDSANNSEKGQHTFLGYLKGHNGEVTSLACGHSTGDGLDSKIFISGSRDRKIMIWKLNPSEDDAKSTQKFGEPWIALRGHSHFVSDLLLTKENSHIFSSSWDKTIRLWDIKTGACIQQFIGAQKEIMSVAISNDSRKVYSTGLENGVSLWNTKGKFMEQSKEKNHQDWVSRIRYSPSSKNDYFATVGWDGRLKIWVLNFQLKSSFIAHEGPINALAIATNGLFLATGGRDQFVKIWKLNALQEPFQTVKCSSSVNDIAFNPQLKLFAVATDKDVCVYSMEPQVKEPTISIEAGKEQSKTQGKFSSIAWSASGKNLFCGCGNGDIAVYKIEIK